MDGVRARRERRRECARHQLSRLCRVRDARHRAHVPETRQKRERSSRQSSDERSRAIGAVSKKPTARVGEARGRVETRGERNQRRKGGIGPRGGVGGKIGRNRRQGCAIGVDGER